MAAPKQPRSNEQRGILMILWGTEPFRKLVLEPGQALTFGRDARADEVISDGDLDPLHGQVWFSGRRLEVRDLDSARGTTMNGELRPRGVVEHGGFFTAGQTTFQFFVEAHTPPTDEPPTPERQAALAQVRETLGPAEGLYGVMDAARSSHLKCLLQEGVDEHRSLYEGVQGRTLDEVAPYLVRFSPDSLLVDRLLSAGWGDAWGIYFRSQVHPKEVRRHLRRFLMVRADEPHERLYFRYYDPRVMRSFLPEATTRQRADLLTGIDRLIVEGPAGEILTDSDLTSSTTTATEALDVSNP
ncbi:MAG: DUF4123 domain-containing protein [Deltaproteobacteria bacterium]|nr:DUF4123 domain-containing protein [Deltaproteobacteria bacterium]